MQWDYKDQLSATARQAVNDTPPNKVPETTFYVYDASGERVRKVTERQNGTRKNERIYLGGFELYREFKSNGTDIKLERETLPGMDDKQRIALVETKTITNPDDESPAQLIRFQFGNQLGSAWLELDDKANVISYEEYYPYGSTAYQAVDKGIKAAAKQYRYTGKERDEETGLYYHGARYYAPWLGMWVSCDPSGMVDGLNLYVYVRGNPINLYDSSGLEPEDPKEGDGKPKGGHDNNKSEPNRNDHEEADTRRQNEQDKSRENRGEPKQRGKDLQDRVKKQESKRKEEYRKKAEEVKKKKEGEATKDEPEWERKKREAKEARDEKREEREGKENDTKRVPLAPTLPYRQPGERPFQPDHPYFPDPTPRPKPSPAPPAPAPTPVPVDPTPKPLTEPSKPYFPDPAPKPPLSEPPAAMPAWKKALLVTAGVTLITVGVIGTAVLAGDDVTGIGVADDILIPVTVGLVVVGFGLVNNPGGGS